MKREYSYFDTAEAIRKVGDTIVGRHSEEDERIQQLLYEARSLVWDEFDKLPPVQDLHPNIAEMLWQDHLEDEVF